MWPSSHITFLALLIFILPASTQGHEDVNESVARLSAKIAETPSADLLYQRALEYRALRKNEDATADLWVALTLAPTHRPAITALIELLGPSPESLSLINKFADFAETPEDQFEATFLLAQYYLDTNFAPVALFLCQGLQKLRPHQDPALDFLHAETLFQLNKPTQAAAIFHAAWKRTDSIVLRNNWIDTLLTANTPRPALPIIEEELATSRFRSSWLIRRARAALILNDPAQAQRDLSTALSELSSRIRPSQPDLTLIADRGLIYALQGKEQKAQADLTLLKKSVLPPSAYRTLSEVLKKETQSKNTR